MKSRYEDYQKIIQNLFKSAYGVVKRKITIFLKLDVFEKFVKNLSNCNILLRHGDKSDNG